MKARREHRIPLSVAAVVLVQGVAQLWPEDGRDCWAFPGQTDGKPLSNMSLLMLVRRMNAATDVTPARWRDGRTGEPIVPHGFRSTFRDWAEEVAGAPRSVSEAALAHTISDKVEAAYRRGDLFEKRRALMCEWALFCGNEAKEVNPPGTESELRQ